MNDTNILKALEPVRQFLLNSNVDDQTSNSVKTQFKTAQDIIASKDYDNDLVVLSQVCLTALRYLNNPPKEFIDITLECLNKIPPKEGEMLDIFFTKTEVQILVDLAVILWKEDPKDRLVQELLYQLTSFSSTECKTGRVEYILSLLQEIATPNQRVGTISERLTKHFRILLLDAFAEISASVHNRKEGTVYEREDENTVNELILLNVPFCRNP